MLGCCLPSFHFLSAILCPQAVHLILLHFWSGGHPADLRYPLSPRFLFVAPGVWPAEKERERERGRERWHCDPRPMVEYRSQWVDRSINMSICFLSSNPVMTPSLARLPDEQLALQLPLPHPPSLTPTFSLSAQYPNEGSLF